MLGRSLERQPGCMALTMALVASCKFCLQPSDTGCISDLVGRRETRFGTNVEA